MESTDAKVLNFHASISEGEITQFLEEPQTARFQIQTQYLTHSDFLNLMFFSWLPEHRKEEIDQISTERPTFP